MTPAQGEDYIGFGPGNRGGRDVEGEKGLGTVIWQVGFIFEDIQDDDLGGVIYWALVAPVWLLLGFVLPDIVMLPLMELFLP